jgi:hypothetical protein
MAGNLERYKKDIERLTLLGMKLTLSLQKEANPKDPILKEMTKEELTKLPDVRGYYQAWYSESLAVLMQIMPERVDDFKSYYASKTGRKEITFANYTMTDYLRGITGTRYDGKVIAGTSSGFTPMYQQYKIIEGLKNRFESTLYDIKTLVHADVLDDELQAAEELNKNGFRRGAGAVAGVVLDGHLGAVCQRHNLTLRKKDPTIADHNDALKAGSVLDVPQWRFIQHLGDIRNKCDHKKQAEPTKEEVNELIEGV